MSNLPWENEKLEKLVDKFYQGINTVADKVVYVEKGHKVLQAKHITSGAVEISDARSLSEKDFEKYKDKYSPKKDDVLLSNIGTIGRTAYVKSDSSYLLAWNIFLISFKDEYLPKFGKYYFEYLEMIDHYAKLETGNATKFVNKSELKGLDFPVPDFSEQKKIARVLTSVDKVIELTETEIEKLKNLKKGMMQDLLTKGIGHTKFKDSPIGRIPEGWETSKLDLLKKNKNGIVDGPFGSNLKTVHYKSEGIPIMQSGFVTSNKFFAKKYLYVDESKFEEQKRSAISGGDILMAKIGAKCGTCAIVPKKHPVSILAGNSMKLTFDQDKVLNSFVLNNLHFWGLTGKLNRLKTETAQPALNITSLKKAIIPLPSVAEQSNIITILETINANEIRKIEKLKQVKNMKKGLMQDLLTGKVRVKL